MARNKYPEKTREKIIEVATKLFIEKGYEKTSLNDIIDNLGGLTKGAIYQHFKSKEDILVDVINELTRPNSENMYCIMNDKSLNGREKIEKMYLISLDNPKQENLFAFVPNLLDNPSFLTYYLKFLIYTTIPKYIVPVIKEGFDDGSIKTEYPEETASLIMFLTDVWLNPLIINMTNEEIIKKAKLINLILKPTGIQLFSEHLLSRLSLYNAISPK